MKAPKTPEQLRIKVLGSDVIDQHLGELMIPDGMKPLLKEQIIQRGLKVVAGFIGERLVCNVVANPDSPVRPETMAHLPYPTPSLSMLATSEAYRGRGYATDILGAVCGMLRNDGFAQVYLMAEVGAPYQHSGESDRTLHDFYTDPERGFRDWGHGPVQTIQHAADATPVEGESWSNVYVKSLIPEEAAPAPALPVTAE